MGLDLSQPLLATAPRELLYVSVGYLVVFFTLLKFAPGRRVRLASSLRMYALCFFLHFAAFGLYWMKLFTIAEATNVMAFMVGAMAIINLAAVFVFNLLLARQAPPIIVRDLVVAVGYVATALWLMTKAGVSLSGIVTTSALLTAIVAFALQESLSNLVGGLALQLEDSIEVGDWIKVDQTVGKVKEIRWRHTAIETRNWETVLIPNSAMVKNQVVILGERDGQPVQWRRWIYFNVDFRVPPSQVIEVVTEALQSGPTRCMATDPPPNCILFDFKESYCQYAVRYWLTDLAADDPTDSAVRIRIHFALARAGVALSIPAATMFVEEQSQEKKESKLEREMQRRLEVLEGQELFRGLTDTERHDLVAHMRFAPFVKDETMTRQGMEGHWLYLLARGSAGVYLTVDGASPERVATLHSPDFFGEMALLTGDKRSATVVALEDSECYRLDREAFQGLIRHRPEIANHISDVLAHRRVELEAVRQQLDVQARQRMMQDAKQGFFDKISRIFGLEGPTRRV